MSAQIKVAKGVIYFPTRDAAVAYAAHCGFPNAKAVKLLRGWAIKEAA